MIIALCSESHIPPHKHPKNKPESYHIIEGILKVNIFENDDKVKIYAYAYGHSIFANTQKYKDAFLENEDFVSYGPEDQERAYRFQKLGYKVNWYDGYVYHIEHIRTNDSWSTNPFFQKNCNLFEYIKTLSQEQLLEFYKNRDYLKKYL